MNNPLLQSLGSLVLGIIEPLGLMTHIMLINIEYPLNARLFTNSIFPIVSFDMIPTDDLYAKLFSLDDVDDEPVSAIFEEIGYESKLSMNNLGSLFLLLIFQPLQIFIFKMLKKACFCKKEPIAKTVTKISDSRLDSLIWNGLLSFYQSTYLVTTMIALINMHDLRLDSEKYSFIEVTSSLLALILLAMAVLVPLIVSISLLIKISEIDNSDVQYEEAVEKIYKRFGEQIRGFNLIVVDYKKVVFLYFFGYLHMFLVLCTVLYIHSPSIQI